MIIAQIQHSIIRVVEFTELAAEVPHIKNFGFKTIHFLFFKPHISELLEPDIVSGNERYLKQITISFSVSLQRNQMILTINCLYQNA